MKGFLAYKYDDSESERMAGNLKEFLVSLNIIPVDGKPLFLGEPLNDQIKESIKKSNFLIAIHLSGFTNNFLNQEIGFAAASNIPVILISDGTSDDGSLMSHHYKLNFRQEGMQNATALINTINKIRISEDLALSKTDEGHKNKILSELSKFDWFNREKIKRNYRYQIILEEHQDPKLKDRFFLANFHIHFEAILLYEEVVIETTRTDDNFCQIYDSLVRNPKSIYRYILKTEEKVKLNNLFNIKKITINKLRLQINPKRSSGLEPEHVQFECSHPHLQKLIDTQVNFDIEIETIVDKRRNEFTVIFGYPVENLETSLLHRDSDINKVDVVDMLTSKSPTMKSRMTGNKNYGAQASYTGWIFPNSGITYIWNRPNE